MDQLVDSFVASRLCGFHDQTEKPEWGNRAENRKYLRAIRSFQMALQRGTVPAPDQKRGRQNMWRLSTLKRHVAGKGVTNARAAT